MPDFGLTEALANALKASKGTPVMRAAEMKMAQTAARAAPASAASVVPGAVERPVARMAPAPEAVAPDVPPAPAPVPGTAPVEAPRPAMPDAVPASPDAVGAPGTAAPPVPPESPVAPSAAPPPAPGTIAPANRLLPAEPPIPYPTPEIKASAEAMARAHAERFVRANMADFGDRLNMTHMPNTDVMASPDKVKASILQVADDNAHLIETARGGTVTDEQLIGLAQDLAINQDSVRQAMTTEFGNDPARLASVALAARMIEQHQTGQLLGLTSRIADGAGTDADLVQFQQQMQQFIQYRTALSGAAAVSGRTQRAFGIAVGLPGELPPEVLEHISNVISRNNPDIQATAAAIRLAGTPAGIANIVGGMADIPVWRRMGMATSGLIQRVFFNGILSGPSTWFKIFVGNNINMAANTVDLFAAGIGRGIVGLATHAGEFPTAAEGVLLSDAMANVHGIISSSADALRVAGRVLKTGQSLDEMLRVGEGASVAGRSTTTAIFPGLQDTYLGAVVHGMDTVIDLPGRVIGSIDDFTKTMGYRGYVTMMSLKEVRARLTAGTLREGDAEQIMQDMMKNPSPELQQAAEDWAHRMTFQSPFAEGGAGEKFQNFLTKAPALRLIFPFMRTATNIFKQSLTERTPLAIFSARLRAQIAAGGFEGDLAKSRIATGTAIISMVAWMGIHDRITGDSPKDPKERALWELDGRRANSIRITNPITGKDEWRDYTWFEPMSTIASTVADIVALQAHIAATGDVDSMMPHDAQINDAISHVAASVIQNTGNKTFMQGASAFSEMYTDPQRAFSMWANQMAANMTPFSGLTKFARNEQDPFLRQAFTIIDKLKDQLPTFGGIKGSKTLSARLDIFGEPRGRRAGNSILGPLNPLPSSADKSDELTDEIHDLMHQTRTVPLTMPSHHLAYLGSGKGLQDGQGMRLTPEEYNDYTRAARAEPIFNGGKQTFRERLEQTMNSASYQAASPAVRVGLLAQVQHSADKLGAKSLWDNNPDFRERMIDWTAEVNRLKYNR